MLAGVQELITDTAPARKTSSAAEDAEGSTGGAVAQARDSSAEPGQDEDALAADLPTKDVRQDSGAVSDEDKALRSGEVVGQGVSEVGKASKMSRQFPTGTICIVVMNQTKQVTA